MSEAKKLDFTMDDLTKLKECLEKSVNMTQKHTLNPDIFYCIHFSMVHAQSSGWGWGIVQ